jgi:hypothetical protein
MKQATRGKKNPRKHEHLHSKARELKSYMEQRRARPSVATLILAGAQFIFSSF